MKVVPMNITMREGNLLLVNANFALHKEDKSDLVSATQSYPEILVKKKVSEVLQQVFRKIGCEEHIVPVSGYRTVEEQKEIYETSLRESGEDFTRKFVAFPYCSEHQTGLAIDLGLKKDEIDFICPEFPYEGICNEFREAAINYGFIERYPKGKEHITGIAHDYLFLYFVCKLGLDLSKVDNMSADDISDFYAYLEDGGLITIKQFMQLSYEEKQAVCGFLENASVYDVVKADDKKYVLVHAGISNFNEPTPLEEYDYLDFICERTNYQKRYYQDRNTYVITGHTPTMYINTDSSPEVYIGNGHIAIDCGCVYGGKLAAYCIETGTVIYTEAKQCYLK